MGQKERVLPEWQQDPGWSGRHPLREAKQVPRGRKSAAAAALALLVLCAALWRANQSVRHDNEGVAHASPLSEARASKGGASKGVMESSSSGLVPADARDTAAHPGAPQARGDNSGASAQLSRSDAEPTSLRSPKSSVRPTVRREGRVKPVPKIERPEEEEIHIIRDDDSAGAIPF